MGWGLVERHLAMAKQKNVNYTKKMYSKLLFYQKATHPSAIKLRELKFIEVNSSSSLPTVSPFPFNRLRRGFIRVQIDLARTLVSKTLIKIYSLVKIILDIVCDWVLIGPIAPASSKIVNFGEQAIK